MRDLDLTEDIGLLFITGFEGKKPSEEFLEFISQEKIGGVILFEEQCNPHSMAEETIGQIMEVSGKIPFIAVDQEGGRVSRFRGAPVELMAAEEYGRTKNYEAFREAISRSTYYLRSLGVNLLLAPVADIRINDENSCLDGRTFGNSPATVMRFVDIAVRAARKSGLLSCIKHFPGLGAAAVDPHLNLSKADYDMQSFLNRESLPFKAGIGAGTDMIMTTHLLVPSFDNKPVTESEIIIDQLLRDKLDYDGVVITDDLLMKGADALGSPGEKALKAFRAGHDILLFGRDYKATREAVKSMKEALRTGQINNDRLEMTLDRVNGLKSKLATAAML